ncbi:uncharacterized protein UDID_02734 [Ustilago sp. UG-2017a]|uniref:Dolichol phosphate-mannose biosynthesis regulatory protein n=1 Tax=Ustilago bromivora TaxID=307758 RepID=A0A1K0GN42_9BASI|nr:uncharacterized protein UBRO_02734 [Ustilago bromivora]SOV04709.1 uncharacterized protein UDID_02734 [Ustilago sp. UG-2017a]
MARSVNQPQVQGTSNRIVGSLILFTALSLFGVYTLWAIVLPFLPDDSPIHTWVPDRRWTITIPSVVLVVGLSTVGIYIGLLLREDAKQDLAKQATGLGSGRKSR